MENYRLRNYINDVFGAAPQTTQTAELKEEIIQNLNEKYNDLIEEGKSEEAAFNLAVSGLGDVSELIASLQNNSYTAENTVEQTEERKKQSLLLAVAIGLYILCPLPLIILDEFGFDILGLCFLLIMIAAATGIIIFYKFNKPKSFVSGDTVVKEFKQWQIENDDKYSIYKSISSAVTAIGIALYFIISFQFGGWHITWIIFLIIPAVNNIIKAIFHLSAN